MIFQTILTVILISPYDEILFYLPYVLGVFTGLIVLGYFLKIQNKSSDSLIQKDEQPTHEPVSNTITEEVEDDEFVTVNFCTQCGNAVLPGAKFCGQCGAPVIDSA